MTNPELRITAQAADFVDNLRYEDIPAEALKTGRRCILDGLGVMVPGTMSKPLQVGRATENGVTAALLAMRGFTADLNAFDGPWGYCHARALSRQ